uniref:non-specific serine/threonine protein kinase n=1 Tax=Nelumbo nucifera TaxID=4432 RepID=A0A822YPU2_NELNU|nr:TPA_asm: hypothetical protein HUJ06_012462 [Nelumbo nucifera]
MDEDILFPSDIDLDFSCTSNTSTNCTFTSSSACSSLNVSFNESLHLNQLKLVRHIDNGNLGLIFVYHLEDYDRANFALKVVDKDVLTAKKLSHVEMEAKVFSMVDHPFLPMLYAHLEESHYSCLLINYCPGGDLQSILCKQSRHHFQVDSVHFSAMEVLVALEYLQALRVVY